MSDKWHDIVVKIDTKLDVLNERMDRHSQNTEQRFNAVNLKLDILNDKIHDNEITVVKETGATNAKIAGISGGMSMLTTGFFLWLKSKFGG